MHLTTPGLYRLVCCDVGIRLVDRHESRVNKSVYRVPHGYHISGPSIVVEYFVVKFGWGEAASVQIRGDVVVSPVETLICIQ